MEIKSDAANAALFIRLAAPFADNLMNSVAHCRELPINVERPLRHIYELNAWLVTYGCRRPDERPRRDVPSTVGVLHFEKLSKTPVARIWTTDF